MYKGIVENNASDLKVQVRIVGIHSDDATLIPTEALPWAEVQYSVLFSLNGGVGATSVIQIGTWVYLDLLNGDEERPVVTGIVATLDDVTGELQENFADIQQIVTKSGHIIKLSDVEGEEVVSITHKSGSKFEMTNEDVSIVSPIFKSTNTTETTFDSPLINLGVGGLPIARVGDQILVTFAGTATAAGVPVVGTAIGLISTGGLNTSL